MSTAQAVKLKTKRFKKEKSIRSSGVAYFEDPEDAPVAVEPELADKKEEPQEEAPEVIPEPAPETPVDEDTDLARKRWNSRWQGQAVPVSAELALGVGKEAQATPTTDETGAVAEELKARLSKGLPVLPIHRSKADILKTIETHQFCVITGDTGSGKSTQLSQFLYSAGYGKKGVIGITQPRRIGAVSLAKRVCKELDVELGQEVGYAIRFDDVSSSKTIIKYLTDGCLLRECLIHRKLEPYSVLILDEAHERSLQTDILFGVVRAIARARPDLKVIVTSATLDTQKFCKYFNNCPFFHTPGRCFPVEVHHAKETPRYYVEACVDEVLRIHLHEPLGHVLVFLTGQEQIEKACKMLEKKVDSLHDDGVDMPDIVILPVFAAMPANLQQRIFAPAPPDTRKVLFSTNICETSVTVDGVVYVVDPGFVKQKVFNPSSGIDALIVTPISQTQASQRAGRAGRTTSGKCYRLYPKDIFDSFPKESQPEIQRTNLSNTVLLLKSLGVADPLSFDFLDNPSRESLVDALLQLFYLNALSDDGDITPVGKAMSQFPLEPNLSRLILASVQFKCVEEILTIAAMLSAENLWIRPMGDKEMMVDAEKKHDLFSHPSGDYISLLALYEAWSTNGRAPQWCSEHFINFRAIKKAQEVRVQLELILKKFQQERGGTRNSNSSNGRNNQNRERRDADSKLDRDDCGTRKRKGSNSRSRSRSRRRSRSRSRSRDRDHKKSGKDSSEQHRQSTKVERRRKNSQGDEAETHRKTEYDFGLNVVNVREEDLRVGPIELACRAIAVAYFPRTARRSGDAAYRLFNDSGAGDRPAGRESFMYIHPSSCLKQSMPKWIIYHELVFTTKPFMRTVCSVEYHWVEDLLPRLKEGSIKRLTGHTHPPRVDDLVFETPASPAPEQTKAPVIELKESAQDRAVSARERFLARQKAKSTGK